MKVAGTAVIQKFFFSLKLQLRFFFALICTQKQPERHIVPAVGSNFFADPGGFCGPGFYQFLTGLPLTLRSGPPDGAAAR